MWKLLAVALIMVQLSEAQRSFYAARPGSHSQVLYQFRRNQTESTTSNSIDSRGGEEVSDSSTTTALPPELQGTLEDQSFVHRVNSWPENRQPFWFKNRFAISSMRGRNVDGSDPRFGQEFQTPFLGRSRVRSRTSLNAPTRVGTNNENNENNEVTRTSNEDPLVLYLRNLRRQ